MYSLGTEDYYTDSPQGKLIHNLAREDVHLKKNWVPNSLTCPRLRRLFVTCPFYFIWMAKGTRSKISKERLSSRQNCYTKWYNDRVLLQRFKGLCWPFFGLGLARLEADVGGLMWLVWPLTWDSAGSSVGFITRRNCEFFGRQKNQFQRLSKVNTLFTWKIFRLCESRFRFLFLTHARETGKKILSKNAATTSLVDVIKLFSGNYRLSRYAPKLKNQNILHYKSNTQL